MRSFTLSILTALALACLLHAQTSEPFVVPAATAAPPKPATTLSDSKSTADLLKMLKDMKAANDETLRKQTAALEQLDELEKVADQIRLNTRRS
jgi:uncharacterized protein YpuA (DUF1002 family)